MAASQPLLSAPASAGPAVPAPPSPPGAGAGALKGLVLAGATIGAVILLAAVLGAGATAAVVRWAS